MRSQDLFEEEAPLEKSRVGYFGKILVTFMAHFRGEDASGDFHKKIIDYSLIISVAIIHRINFFLIYTAFLINEKYLSFDRRKNF